MGEPRTQYYCALMTLNSCAPFCSFSAVLDTVLQLKEFLMDRSQALDTIE